MTNDHQRTREIEAGRAAATFGFSAYAFDKAGKSFDVESGGSIIGSLGKRGGLWTASDLDGNEATHAKAVEAMRAIFGENK